MTGRGGVAVDGLKVSFATKHGLSQVVNGVSFEVAAGETLGIVGESGSGKSVTALSLIRLLPPNGYVTRGRIELDGVDIHAMPARSFARTRGRRIGMVFQDSMTSLNPVLSIGRQITESLELHLGLGRRERSRRAEELLAAVGVSEPRRRMRQYPHQLSGGIRQRVAVAIALAPDPDVLVADEPTTALDVTIQAQLLALLKREQAKRGMTLILITHDLGVAAAMTDRLCVMYAGRIVEHGTTDAIFRTPRHPYTQALIGSVPRLDTPLTPFLASIPGAPPAFGERLPGCAFRPRCPVAREVCATDVPPLDPVGPGQAAACWRSAEGEGAA